MQQSVQALRDARHQDHNIFQFYFSYMNRAAHGDLGTSLALGQPVRTLLRDRAPLTLRLLAMGLGLAWMLTLTLALSAAWLRLSVYDTLTTVVSGTFLCIPAAVLALLSVLWNVPGLVGDCADRVPAHVPLCAKSAGEGLFPASHHHCESKGSGRGSHSFLACRAGGDAAVAGRGRSVGEHGGRRGHSSRSFVRAGGHRTTGMAGGAGPRSSTAG